MPRGASPAGLLRRGAATARAGIAGVTSHGGLWGKNTEGLRQARRSVPTFSTWWRIALGVGLLLGTTAAVIAVGASTSSGQPPGASGQPMNNLLLAECDPGGYVPCNQQAAILSLPIVDTGLSLTYSSQWAAARPEGGPGWATSRLGLGGWSVNVLQGYDATEGILIGGDGTWRFARAVRAGPGEVAVPSYDGTLAYVFNEAGQQLRTVDGRLGMTFVRFAYDSKGRLSQVTGTLNGAPVHLTVRRSADGTQLALVGIDGASTSLTLDSRGDLATLRDPAGRTTHLTWQTGGLVTAETDPSGAITHFRYGAEGGLGSETDPDGVTERMSRLATATRVQACVTTKLGRVWTYISQLSGRSVRRTYVAPGGATTTETTASNGSFTLHLPDGTVSTVTTAPSTGWGLSAPVLSSVVTTVANGPTSWTETEQDLHEVGGLPYVVTGSVSTTANGFRSVETFGPATRTIKIIDGAGRTTTDTYDERGLLISSSAPGSPAVTYSYDGDGRVVKETVGDGPAARTTGWAYHASNGTVTVTRPDGSTLTQTVDAEGNPATVKGPGGAVVIETYNPDGLLTGVQPPGGEMYTLGYSASGRPTAFVGPSVNKHSAVETATYDGNGDLKSISGLGDKPVTATYDAAGNASRLNFDQGTMTASYNPATGLLDQAEDPDGVRTTFEYSGATPDRIIWSGPVRGSVTENYGANGIPVSESADGGPALGFAYDGAGNLTAVGPLSLRRGKTTGLMMGSRSAWSAPLTGTTPTTGSCGRRRQSMAVPLLTCTTPATVWAGSSQSSSQGTTAPRL